MAQINYVISTTALSLTASGTTVASGNTNSGTFELARSMTRTGLSANELSSGTQNWVINYVVSAMTTPYEMYFKLVRKNSSGVAQSTSNAGTTRSSTGTYQDTISWDSGTWAANDQLCLEWWHRRPSGTGNKSGTINANGSSYVTAPAPDPKNVTPSNGVLTIDGFAPTFSKTNNFRADAGVGVITITGFAPTVFASDKREMSPSTGEITVSGFAPTWSTSDNTFVYPSTNTLTIESFAPTVTVLTNLYLDPDTGILSIEGFSPTVFTTQNRNITIGLGELSFTGFAPAWAMGSTLSLETRLFGLTFSFDGSPFLYVVSRSEVSTEGLEYSFDGSPFWAKNFHPSMWATKSIKVYIGGAWTAKPLKAYLGGTWTEKILKVYT